MEVIQARIFRSLVEVPRQCANEDRQRGDLDPAAVEDALHLELEDLGIEIEARVHRIVAETRANGAGRATLRVSDRARWAWCRYPRTARPEVKVKITRQPFPVRVGRISTSAEIPSS